MTVVENFQSFTLFISRDQTLHLNLPFFSHLERRPVDGSKDGELPLKAKNVLGKIRIILATRPRSCLTFTVEQVV